MIPVSIFDGKYRRWPCLSVAVAALAFLVVGCGLVGFAIGRLLS